MPRKKKHGNGETETVTAEASGPLTSEPVDEGHVGLIGLETHDGLDNGTAVYRVPVGERKAMVVIEGQTYRSDRCEVSKAHPDGLWIYRSQRVEVPGPTVHTDSAVTDRQPAAQTPVTGKAGPRVPPPL